MYPVLKDVPYVNLILPDTVAEESGDAEYGYTSLSEAIAQIKVLEQENDAQRETIEALEDEKESLQSEISRLSAYESSYADFQKIREEFYEKVVFSDEAPDIEEYKAFYESIEPEYAAELYKQVVKETAYSDEVKSYAATYAAMKPKNAAALMEEMTDNLSLVCEILGAMSTDARAAILDAMDAEVAASITKLMAPSE